MRYQEQVLYDRQPMDDQDLFVQPTNIKNMNRKQMSAIFNREKNES